MLPSSRASAESSCPCTVCCIARMDMNEYKEYLKGHKNSLGRPSLKPKMEDPKNIKICEKCLSEIHPGKTHMCLETVKRENLCKLLENSSTNSKSSVISSGLKELANGQGESNKGGVIKIFSGGPQLLPVQIGTSRTRPVTQIFSHENVNRLGTQLNLSNNSLM